MSLRLEVLGIDVDVGSQGEDSLEVSSSRALFLELCQDVPFLLPQLVHPLEPPPAPSPQVTLLRALALPHLALRGRGDALHWRTVFVLRSLLERFKPKQPVLHLPFLLFFIFLPVVHLETDKMKNVAEQCSLDFLVEGT